MFNTDYQWSVGHSEYSFERQVQCEFSGKRTYTKLNSLKALGGLAKIHHGSPSTYFTGPVFVSTNPEAIVYYTSYQSYQHFPTKTYSFEYLGVIWYVGEDGYFWEGLPLIDDLGNLLPISDTVYSRSRADLVDLAKALIDLAEVTILEPSPMVYIPSLYQQVEYIESTSGRAAIDTGIHGDFSCELDIEFTGNGYRQLMGVSLNGTNFIGITSGNYLEVGGSSSWVLGTTRNNVTFLHNSECIELLVGENMATNGVSSYDSSNNMKIFTGVDNVDQYLCIGKIYRCKIYSSDGTLPVRDMYPVYRVSDNKPGMFDTITEEFFTTIGPSDFITGPEVVPPIEIRNLVLYNNELWELDKEFRFTGSAQEFTLQPGRYLIECNGAKGGTWDGISIISRGGTSYGILNLQTATTMYAVVGGDGGNSSANGQLPGAGGYNGGGTGGISTSYANGPGGGGGTDVRLTMTDVEIPVDVTIPDGYDELEYIESDGSQYIDTGYKPKTNTKVELVCEIHNNVYSSWAVLFGSRNGSYNDNFAISCNDGGEYKTHYAYNASSADGTSFPENVTVKIIADGPVCYVYDDNDQLLYSVDTETSRFDSDYPLYIFAMNHPGSTTDRSSYKLMSMKIFEGNTLIHYYLPTAETGTGNDPGLYDLVSETFLYKGYGNDFTYGNAKVVKTSITKTAIIPKSFLSRFIVAGGGGGASYLARDDSSYPTCTMFGGGVYGGYPVGNSYDPNDGEYASQTSGYQFGVGMSGLTRESSTQGWSGEGSGGGGGGWYGGYTSSDNGTNYDHSSGNGGGGSGFVLTSASKSITPQRYFMGFEDRINEFCMTGALMIAGYSEASGVKVYKHTTSIMAQDRIVCPCVGHVEQMKLPKGKFRFKLIGGCGGMRPATQYTNFGYGGYAEGILDNQSECRLYIRVGGSAINSCIKKPLLYIQTTFPTMSYNGGVLPYETDTYEKAASASGGASDIRVNTDSLYARLIVAGGAGGISDNNCRGGHGGGNTGGTGVGNRDLQNGGAGGTQTESPAMDPSEYMGGFGYGAPALWPSHGPGGGGWYGGNTDTNWATIGGGGGSGYVLTADSYKPSGYLLGPEYYLSGTQLVQGYIPKYPEYTSIIIECLERGAGFGILAEDSAGYKEYNATSNRWETFTIAGEELSPEDFDDHGISNFPSDAGLNNNYSILVYDPTDSYNTAVFNIVPPTQHIDIKHDMSAVLRSLSYDYDYDHDTTSVLIAHSVKRKADGSQYLDIDIDVTFNDIPATYPKFYDIIGYTLGSVIPNPTDPRKREKHLQHIDLLPIRAVKRVPSREKNYIGDTLYNGNTIVSSQSSAATIKDRSVYTVTECNNSVFRFAKLDLVTNQSTVIKDIPKSSFNNICIGDMVAADGAFYISSSQSGTDTKIFKVSSDPNDTTVAMTGFTNNTSAKGKMRWLTNDTFVIFTNVGFGKYETSTDRPTEVYKSGSQLGERADFTIGEKYIFTTGGSNASSFAYDIENDTWSTISLGWGSNAVCCYGNGKYYVTEPNYIYIVDEETLTLDRRIATPYESLSPKTIDYANGFLYVSVIGASSVYIYDINRGEFSVAGTTFTPSTMASATGNFRPCTFSTYFFMANVKMFVCNFAARAKYNIGLKGDQFIIPTNINDLEINDYTYNPRYVSFDESSMFITPSSIIKPLTIIDIENMIKRVSISKSDYGKLSSVRFIEVEESEG